MKLRIASITAATLFAATMTMAADGSWTGWISDSQCGAKGANAKAGECTTKCVKEHGAKYVFVNDADKKVYVVDAQDKVAAHAGHHVTVKGSVDGDTLKLSSIDMAPEKGM
jgi:triosephosphate isomerase